MNKATRAAIEKIVNALETLGDEVESLHDERAGEVRQCS